jgi:hypothetical protein
VFRHRVWLFNASVLVVTCDEYTHFTAESIGMCFVYESYLMDDYKRWLSNSVLVQEVILRWI